MVYRSGGVAARNSGQLFVALLIVKIEVNFFSLYIVELENRIASDHFFSLCWTN